MSSPGEWYASLPPLTKLYGTSCFLTTVAFQLGLVNPAALALFWKPVVSSLQLWRVLTCFIFLGKFSMSFAVQLLWIFRYGLQLESITYAGRPGDYAYLLLVLMALLVASTLLLPSPLLGPSLIMGLVYTWSRANPTARISFFGIFTVEGFYLPFALLAWTVLSGGDPEGDVRGIVAGHVYYFLSAVWPRAGGPRLLDTPPVVHQAVQWAFGGFGYVNPNYARPAAQAAAFRGRGRRLNE